jgi:trimeric autotransporter adhesin
MPTLTITATHNYTGDSLPANITDILFNTSGSTFATFAATQFGGNPISNSVHITGDLFRNTLIVNLSGTFSAAGWTFLSWDSTADVTILAGSSGADTITGSSQGDTIVGLAGADSLSGGGGNDEFQYTAPGEIVAGETVNGGPGTDHISVFGGGSFDFSGAVLTSIEQFRFASADTMTATFAANQIGAGAITSITTASPSVAENLIVNGTNVDLSALTFFLWTSGTDTVTINGTSGADLLTGSSQSDIIIGGGGADAMNGGTNDDTFVFNAATDIVSGESVNGGAGTDALRFSHTGVLDFQPATVTSIEQIDFENVGGFATIEFAASQFGAGISNTVQITGNNEINHVQVNLTAAGAFSAAGWTFAAGWGFNGDSLDFIGSSGADTITGSSQGDQIRGGNGADNIDGGDGSDLFIVDSNDVVAGETLNGGIDPGLGDIDTVNLSSSSATTDLSAATLIDIEALSLNNRTGVIAILGGNQIGAGAITRVFSTPGDRVQSLIVNANGNVDLSAVTFTGWDSPNKTIFINGAAAGNTLIGSNFADFIDGLGGADTMVGRAGNDGYSVDNAGDTVVENPGEGTDTVLTFINFALPANVENLSLAAGVADLQGFGNGLVNAINGNSGNNLIDGGAGADVMQGGDGNDTYFVDNIGDAVTESAGQGNDAVFSSINFALSANVETLVLQGGADLQGFGNGLVNVIFGNTGNNLINGGAAADLMIGGGGNDTYFADDPSDSAFEAANQGSDTVFASCNYGIAADVETLVMQGSGDFQGYGNNQANTLFGNAGNNLLNAAGGVDLMVGGAGNDTYFVDDTSDACFEVANEGSDAVFAFCHYVLAADVETLVMQGSGDFQGYGNNQANTIFGNAGNNLIDGAGGADTMVGGAGNDTYFVDNVGDGVVENPGGGIDSVFAGVTCALSANVEALVLQGAGDIDGIGNALNNSIFGNSGNNALDGGAGADVLTGNDGNDNFVFHMGQAGGDTVLDFDGKGATPGDQLRFFGYGAGATFTQNDATHWQVNFNAGASHEIITFSNGAPIDPSDVLFA